MNGLDLQKFLVAQGRAVRIVFITAQEDDNGEIRRRALAVLPLAFLQKPFADQALLRAVQSRLDVAH